MNQLVSWALSETMAAPKSALAAVAETAAENGISLLISWSQRDFLKEADVNIRVH